MAATSTHSNPSSVRRSREEAERRFTADIEEIDLHSALKRLDAVVHFGAFSLQVGLRAGRPGIPAHHFAHVSSEKTPKDPVPHAVSGWKRKDGFWWEYSTSTKTVEVFIVGDDSRKLQAIIGACIRTQNLFLTQGLILRNRGDDARWGLNVGHGFVGARSTDPSNLVRFCNATADQEQCQYCVGNQCVEVCVTAAVTTSVIASGEDNIKTTNPEPPSGQGSGWMDFAAYKIPNEQAIQHLVVSDVSNHLEKLAGSTPDQQNARDKITALDSVSDRWITQEQLQDLFYDHEDDGVFVFKKGIATGWSFGRLDTTGATSFYMIPVGGDTGDGDCGSIWFVAWNNQAWPAGYHQGSAEVGDHGETQRYAVAAPYWATSSSFSDLTGIPAEDVVFTPGDSYVWS